MEYLSEASREFTSLSIETTYIQTKQDTEKGYQSMQKSFHPSTKKEWYIKYNVKPTK